MIAEAEKPKVKKRRTGNYGSRPLTAAQWRLVTDNKGLAYLLMRRVNVPYELQDDAYADAARPAMMRAARTYDPAKGSFGAYAGRAVYNELRRWFARWKFLAELFSRSFDYADEDGDNLLSPLAPEDREAERAELAATVRAALARLGADDLSLLKDHFYMGRSLKQMRSACGLKSRQGVQYRLRAALSHLRHTPEINQLAKESA